MPKPMFVWSGSAWVSVATEVESLAGFATQSYADNVPAARMIVPSSVTVGSGSGSVSTSGAVTFSGASSVSLNDCFNSTYDNYMILYKNTTTSTGIAVTMRYRLSGTDTTTNYGTQRLYAQGTTVTANRDGVGTDEIYVANLGATTGSFTGSQINVYSPNLASPTISFNSTTMLLDADLYPSFVAGFQNSSTQFTGFTLLANTGTFGGTIRVYGFKN